jgi:hypothetical protein
VFFATDDPKIIPEASAKMLFSSDYKGMTLKYQQIDRDKYDSHELIDARQEMRTGSIAEELFKDMWAMQMCDMFIGQMTSNIDRIAYELMIARKGHYAPYVSLDAPWCDQTGNFKYKGNEYIC